MIKDVINDVNLLLDIHKYDVILIAANNLCGIGKGFLYDLSINFPIIKYSNLETKYGDVRKLGTVKVTMVDNIAFCLCFISKATFGEYTTKDNLDYNALKSCLSLINENFKSKRIATNLIGCDKLEFCGNKSKVLELIESELKDVDVYLYNYEQTNYIIENNIEWGRIKKVLETDGYEVYRKEKIKYLWERTFGIYKPMPDNLSYSELKKIITNERKKRAEFIKNLIKE